MGEIPTGFVDDLQPFKGAVVGEEFVERFANAAKVRRRFADSPFSIEQTSESAAEIQEMHLESHGGCLVENLSRKGDGVAIGIRVARRRTDVEGDASDVQVEQRRDREKFGNFVQRRAVLGA